MWQLCFINDFDIVLDKSISSFEEENYSAAQRFLSIEYNFGPQPYFVMVLMNYYNALLQTDRTDEADRICNEFVALFKEHFSDTAEKVCQTAEVLRSNEEYMSSLAYYQISFAIFESQSEVIPCIDLPVAVGFGIMAAVTTLLRLDKISKKLMKTYYIPYLQEVVKVVKQKFAFDEQVCADVQARIMSFVAMCQEIVYDSLGLESVCEEALSLLCQTFGRKTISKSSTYGILLHYQGSACVQLNKPGQAVQFFSRAIAAKKKATNYASSERKAEDINLSQKSLEIAQQRLRLLKE